MVLKWEDAEVWLDGVRGAVVWGVKNMCFTESYLVVFSFFLGKFRTFFFRSDLNAAFILSFLPVAHFTVVIIRDSF